MVSYMRREVILVNAISQKALSQQLSMKNGAVRKKKHLQTFRAFGIHIWILFKNVVYDFHVFLFNCHVKGSAKLKSRNNILFFQQMILSQFHIRSIQLGQFQKLTILTQFFKIETIYQNFSFNISKTQSRNNKFLPIFLVNLSMDKAFMVSYQLSNHS